MTEETTMPRHIVYYLDADPELPVISSVGQADMGTLLISVVGVGNPYWAFENLSLDILVAESIGVDFTDAPLCNEDVQTNRNNVAGLFASPPPTGPGGKVWAVS